MSYATQTHCKQGHEYMPENTVIKDGYQSCRICRNTADRQRNERQRIYAVKDMRIGHGNYRDTGCKAVSDSCLSCPLPKCKYDDPDWQIRGRQIRDDKIHRLRRTGWSVPRIADEMDLKPRTVYRIVAAEREGVGV